MKYIKVFEEFIENSENVIDGKLDEFKDLIDGFTDKTLAPNGKSMRLVGTSISTSIPQ